VAEEDIRAFAKEPPPELAFEPEQLAAIKEGMDAERLAIEAVLALAKQGTKAALPVFERAVSETKDRLPADARLEFARVLEAEGQKARAVAEYKKAEEDDAAVGPAARSRLKNLEAKKK
jgi:hypothetical protein